MTKPVLDCRRHLSDCSKFNSFLKIPNHIDFSVTKHSSPFANRYENRGFI